METETGIDKVQILEQEPVSDLRVRKTVERFSNDNFDDKPLASKSKKVVAENGSGERLISIPKIAAGLKKTEASSSKLQVLHKVLYGRPGVENKRKRAIGQFNGFEFQNAEDDRAILSRLERLEKGPVSEIAQLLSVHSSGSKSEICARVFQFLKAPSASAAQGRGLVKRKTKKKPARSRLGKKSKSPKSTSNREVDSDTQSDMDSSSVSKEESKASDHNYVLDSEKKQPKKNGKGSVKGRTVASQQKPYFRSSEMADSGSEDGAPAVRAQGSLDSRLEAGIRDLIKSSDNLELLSVKQIRVELEKRFNKDLKPKKEFIGRVARSVLSEMNVI